VYLVLSYASLNCCAAALCASHLQDYVAASTDAWSSSHNAGAHVLNVNVTANGTSVFLDFVFTGADSHTYDYIGDNVKKVLAEWEAEEKVVAFVTDWGSNMQKAGTYLKVCEHPAGVDFSRSYWPTVMSLPD
jgi:hypothetical protein